MHLGLTPRAFAILQIGVLLLPFPLPALRRLHRLSRNVSVF